MPVDRPDFPFQIHPLQARVGTNVHTHRERRGLTQERMAAMLEVDVRYLRRIETGQQNLTLQKIAQIARVLRVDPSELFVNDPWSEDRPFRGS